MNGSPASDPLRACTVCPRRCGVDRRAVQRGACRIGVDPLVASAFPHLGEESCLSGSRGSGTIFLAGCNLGCVFCQNWDLSQRAEGVGHDRDALATLMLELQDRGCHNVNLVTPSHVVPQLVAALASARDRGLQVPVVYNSGGYDGLDSLHRLRGLIDVYMSDFKFWSTTSADRYCGAPDYPDRARAAAAAARAAGLWRLEGCIG